MIASVPRARAMLLAVAILGAMATVPARGAVLDGATASLLASMGVDPAQAIVQRGALNYAGPDCPGAGWTCAGSDRPVVQIGESANNVVDCSGTSSGPDSCTVIQSTSEGDNVARCVLDTTADGVTQRCSIRQTNSTGLNDAVVEQTASQGGPGGAQTNRQEAEVRQTNVGGENIAAVTQAIDLGTTVITAGDATRTQDGFQFALLDQTSTTGNQSADVAQSERFRNTVATTGNIVQEQNTLDDGFNIRAIIDQLSDGGDNEAGLRQTMDLAQSADSTLGTITERQGSPSGGLRGDVDQNSSTGFSHYTAELKKAWLLDPDADVAEQLSDPRCCIFGIGSTPDTCEIVERVALVAPANADQSAFLHGRAFAKQNCTLLQEARVRHGEDEDSFTNREEGTFFDTQVVCDVEGCTEVEVQPEPSDTHLAVRNVSEREEFSRTNPEAPIATHADPGDLVEFKITFFTNTTERITNLFLKDQMPQGVIFVSCMGCEGGAPDEDGVVSFFRRTGEQSGPRSGRYTVRIPLGAEPGSLIVNDAFSESSIGTQLSNEVEIHIRGVPEDGAGEV